MTTKAFIAGCAGLELTEAERAFFAGNQPWGFILFRRNIADRAQVAALTASLRAAVGRHAPILIDQEGGRVQRMRPPNWPAYPAGRWFGQINDPLRRTALARLSARLMAHDLRAVGIDVDCLPVLDVPVAGAHDVIGDRAYAFHPDEVARIGRAAAEGLLAGGVLPVIKHMPGHGRAGADSHLALPRVSAALDDLRSHDFPPFRHLADMPMAMTAHVVFEAIDPSAPATTSRKVFRRIMRGELRYDGLVMTDDLSMKALSGNFAERASAAYAAGCDMILHCNGIMDEMARVAEAALPLAGAARRRAKAALARIAHEPEPLDRGAVAEDIARILAAAG
ncbi:MAG: beta-N-acetylhexosaminidase [Hyphomicrobiales bacterium]|jgi:beta-N-acetylhexosaminidase|nr:beta-N-acetylhexosaminidase [Hyphomicrobiales bacterium]